MNRMKEKFGSMAVATLLSGVMLSTGLNPRPAMASAKAQEVTVTITASGYNPSSVNVKAGKPVRMTFVSKGDGCSNSVKIPALKQSFNLSKGQKKTVTFTPKKGQVITFACGMDMYKGKVVAK